jgi:hypothetical protein
VFERVVDLFKVDWIAYQGLRALKKLPPDFLNILLTLDPSKFRKYLSASKTATMFKSIYNLVRQCFFQAPFAGSRH